MTFLDVAALEGGFRLGLVNRREIDDLEDRGAVESAFLGSHLADAGGETGGGMGARFCTA